MQKGLKALGVVFVLAVFLFAFTEIYSRQHYGKNAEQAGYQSETGKFLKEENKPPEEKSFPEECESELENTAINHAVQCNQTWSGAIKVQGNIHLNPEFILTIKPGTKILFDKKFNASETDSWSPAATPMAEGWNDPTGNKEYDESHYWLKAKIIAIGTKDEPIIFTSAQENPEYADWINVNLLEGSVLDYAEVAYSQNGIIASGGNATIRNTISRDNFWSCIDLWSESNIVEDSEVYHCWHQGIGIKKGSNNVVKRNYIHDLPLAINCEFGAKGIIEENTIKAKTEQTNCELPQSRDYGENNSFERTLPDVPGGTYGGVLVYPAGELQPNFK